MSRSALAVFFGLLVSYGLTLSSDAAFHLLNIPEGDERRLPTLLLAMVAYFLWITIAGWFTGVNSRHAEVAHATVMGLLRLLLSVAIAAQIHGDAPEWWVITRLLLIVPAAVLGGALRAFQRLPQET